MKVFVGDKSQEDPFDYRLVDGRLYVCFDWVPFGMNATLDLDADLCQKAVDGDKCIRGYIESSARRSVVQGLIRDLKQVIGPGWSRALEVLIEHEDMKEPAQPEDSEDDEYSDPPDPMEEIADKYF